MQYSEITKSIKENDYKKYSETLILDLSTPLIIDKKNGFISFESILGSFGYKTLERFTALMKKNKEGKWEIDSYYYDPNSTW